MLLTSCEENYRGLAARCVRLRGSELFNNIRRGLWCVISVRGKGGDRDLVYYSATTRYYAITMHFKRKVIVFSSSWQFLLNLSTIKGIGVNPVTEQLVVWVNNPCVPQRPFSQDSRDSVKFCH